MQSSSRMLGVGVVGVLAALAISVTIPAPALTTTPRVTNGPEPAHGLATLRLEELWRVGGADDDESLFGQVVRVCGDDRGNTYVLDAQLMQVTVYAPDGELVRTHFREGDGPGELRRVCDLVLLPDGLIGAVGRFPAAIVTVDADGNPARSLRLSQRGRGFCGAVCRGGNLVTAERVSVDHPEDGTHTVQSLLGSLAPDGTRLATYLQSDRHVDYHNNYVFNERRAIVDFLYAFDVGPDGRVYALEDADRYAISVFAADGTLERVIERTFAPRKRTEEEQARMEALTERRFRTFPFDISFELAENEAVVPWYLRGLQVADDGRLWVRHSRSGELGRAHDALIVFDVFAPDGRFEQQVAVPAPGRDTTDGVFLTGSDRLVVVHGFVDAICTAFGGGRGGLEDENAEPDPIEVVCYRYRLP